MEDDSEEDLDLDLEAIASAERGHKVTVHVSEEREFSFRQGFRRSR